MERILLEEQADHQVMKKLPAFYQKRKFITVLTTALNLLHQNSPRTPTHFLRTIAIFK